MLQQIHNFNDSGIVKVLFIVTDFYQAGTERFTYEVDKAVNKNLFSISILSLLPLNQSSRWEDYYYSKHLSLGTDIVFLEELKKVKKPSLSDKIKLRLINKSITDEKTAVADFLKKFDVISFWGEYAYPPFEKYLDLSTKSKSIIHIMNSIHQKQDLYKAFDKSKHYKFSSSFNDVELKDELKGFINYDHTFMPLSLNILSRENPWLVRTGRSNKIGIFTRLTTHKPLDPFLYAFQLVLDKIPNLELHIFGSGNPENEGMMRYVKQLNLTQRVFFRGHQSNILETAQNENLDLVWFHGYYGEPGGFAGFDISSLGIPQIFWDFSNSELSKRQTIYPMYNSLSEFVHKSTIILSDRSKAEQLSEIQFRDVSTKRNIINNIAILEQLWTQIQKQSYVV